MKNIVPCKICSKDFEYSPGFSGNNRQFCSDCKNKVDEKELIRIGEEMITENNRYLITAAKRKDEYDPIDILVDGNMPEFKSDADKFICAMELGKFVRQVELTGIEDNFAKLLNLLGDLHAIILVKQLKLQTCEMMCKDKRFRKFTKVVMELST